MILLGLQGNPVRLGIEVKTLFFTNFIYCLFLAVLGLCCCVQAFSSCGEFVAACGLLLAVASLVAEHGL